MRTNTLEEKFMVLRAQAQHTLTGFLMAELQLCGTFVEFARTERDLANEEHFISAKEDAEKALRSVRHFVNRVVAADSRIAIEQQCDELERAVREL